MEEDIACSEVQSTVKGMILGGYALQAICDSYGIKVTRKTKDIDLFTPEAKVLISDDVKVSPTGGRLQLTPDFHAELFDWISGMDHNGDLEMRIIKEL